jgi:acetyltransferase-like isoleucine patch superfamily enzyme
VTEDELIEKAVQEALRRFWRTSAIWGRKDRVSIADGVNVLNSLMNTESGSITVGKDCIFGHNVCLLTGTHAIDVPGKERHPFPRDGRDIVIGEGVWIATNAVVLGPCTIGDNAVVAAGAVLLPGLYDGGIVYGGVPAKPVKTLALGSRAIDIAQMKSA